ncbi:serine protease snake-like [Vanessa cardui]|uniref:serine protease snake-like n=1 Tax=Vanessa cardui TaxID=171605 RepID=UPI001F13CA0C|nr:serine protease snake-like [Vanessa cardui]
MYCKVFLSCIFLFVIQTNGQYEGDKCKKNGVEGVCRNLRNCKSAVDDIKNRRGPPQICSFLSTDPIVCCFDDNNPTTYPPVATTTTRRPTSTTTEYVPPVSYVMNDGCAPISVNLTAKPTGQKAWDKCIEYQHKLIYPCERSVALIGNPARGNHCKHNANELIIGGVPASSDEFPHMVLLGFETPDSIAWLCGGSLLSERFILTAGHCTFSKEYRQVKYARTSVLRRTDPVDPSRFYKIKNIFKHPEYRPPAKYNDIALLETDRDMQLDARAVPACLDTGAANEHARALASGWGATLNRGATADQLQKVILEEFSPEECAELFPPERNLRNGLNTSTQICYGDKTTSRDTCQGDSGGPLQLKHMQIHCMYTVVGVTSYGHACGLVGEPGIYTRVAAYVPWIESIVWP